MGFEIKFSLTESEGCKEWRLWDTTGKYSDPNNLTGWGNVNPKIDDDSTITFYILQYGYTTGYLITLTTESGEITAFTITDPAGVVTDWFDTLTNTTAFTSDGTIPLIITPEMLGLAEGSSFVSSAYYFEENITFDSGDFTGETYTSSADQLITCATCCCIENMKADLEDCGCEDNDDKIKNAMKATMFFDAALIQMNKGDVPKSQDLLTAAKALCEDECSGC
jgi:hypothetical protein